MLKVNNLIGFGAKRRDAAGGDTPTTPPRVDFDAASTESMKRTFASTGDRRQMTFSWWQYQDNSQSAAIHIFFAYADFGIESAGFNVGVLTVYGPSFSEVIQTTAPFFTTNAWTHVVLALDGDATTGANAVRLWKNGTAWTSFNIDDRASYDNGYDWAVNTNVTHWFGGYDDGDAQGTKRLSDFHFIDGQSLDPTNFAFNNGGTWTPKAYAGSYGTNGFHLIYDGVSSSDLGNDGSSNNNDWTLTNISSADYNADGPPT